MTTATTRSGDDSSMFLSIIDALLTDGEWLDDLLLQGDTTRALHHLLAISVIGLMVHGAVVGIVGHELGGWMGRGTPVLWMPLTFVAAVLTSIAVCLPSFYFYTQLSGLDASFRIVTAQSLRVQAKTSVMLLGVLPFYAALAFGAELGFVGVEAVFAIGVTLPFAIGLTGINSLRSSFERLVERLPITHERRGDILLRLVLCWGAVFSTVAPVALWRIGQGLGPVIAV